MKHIFARSTITRTCHKKYSDYRRFKDYLKKEKEPMDEFERENLLIMKMKSKKLTTRTLLIMASLIALTIILSRFLSFSVWNMKIGLDFIPIAVASLIFGPLEAGIVAALSDFLGRISSYYGIWWHITGHDAVKTNNRPVPDVHPRKNYSILANPNIMANNSISLVWHICGRRRFHVPALESIKGKCRYGIHLVIGSVHNEFNPGSNLAKFPDNKLVIIPFVMVCYMTLKVTICNIGKLPNDYIRIFYCWFHIYFFIISRYGMNNIGIRIFFASHGYFLPKLCHAR